MKTYDDYAVSEDMGGVTSECDRVQHLAGMVDHLYYMHGWSREKIASAVQSYEDMRSAAAIVQNFSHVSAAQDKYVKTIITAAGGN